jgi:hypothetical protein
MRSVALLAVVAAAAAACGPGPTHLRAAVTVALASDDRATATVNATAEAYQWVDEEYEVRDMVTGLDAQLELDGTAVPFTEIRPGVLEIDPQTGFPGAIRLRGDGDARDLPHADVFQVAVDRQEGYVRITIDPPLGEGESANVQQRAPGQPAHSEPMYAGQSKIDFPPGYARFVVQRAIVTDDDTDPDGVRIGGITRVIREAVAPCWGAEDCP